MKKYFKQLVIVVLALTVMFAMCAASVFATDKESTSLFIINNQKMFKAITASFETTGDATNLVVALSGDGYHNLFKGTKEQAVANGDNPDNWIKGSVNANGKWEFIIPVGKGETSIPCVAISESKYKDYKDGKATFDKCLYDRIFVINVNEQTLVTDNYSNNPAPAAVTIDPIKPVVYNGKAFKPGVVVKKDGTLLTAGTNYEVEYKDNLNAGTATVIIKGLETDTEKYGGSKTANFIIKKAKNTMTVVTTNKTLKVKKLKKKAISYKAVTVNNPKESVTITAKPANAKSKKALTFNVKNGTIKVKKKTKKGTYKMTVTVTSGGVNYAKATVSKTIKVVVSK